MEKWKFYTYDEINKLHSFGRFETGGIEAIGSDFISVINENNECVASFLLSKYVDNERNYECVYANKRLVNNNLLKEN